MEPVERADIRHKAGTLFFEYLPDRFVSHLWVRMRPGIGRAAILKPGVQLGIGLELRTRHKEPPPDHPHLVLTLTFLPARSGCAGDGIDKVMPTHLLEPAIMDTILANKDRIYRRLRIVIVTPRTGPAKKGECLVMGVEHHLQRRADTLGQMASDCGRGAHRPP